MSFKSDGNFSVQTNIGITENKRDTEFFLKVH